MGDGGSPVLGDTLALCAVLVEELDGVAAYARLAARLEDSAGRLVEHVACACRGIDRPGRLLAADAELCALRAHADIAVEVGLLDEKLYLGLLEQADKVGRQLGGWLKSLRREER